MKILSAQQSREADKFTIKNEPVSSLKLMERAAAGLCVFLLDNTDDHAPYYIFCGKGNNGGDGLALARLLEANQRRVKVFVVDQTGNGSDDFHINLRQVNEKGIGIQTITGVEDIPEIPPEAVVIDAVFGSGLNRPLEDLPAEIITYLNKIKAYKVAIDIPSGLFADDNSENNLSHVFNADITLSIQQPKLSFFHRKTAPLVGEMVIIDIRIHPEYLEELQSPYYYIDFEEARKIYKPRNYFTSKNKFGHVLIIAGSVGKTGAAILSAKGAMRTGAGLVTVHTAKVGLIPLQTNIPEAMVVVDEDAIQISALPDIEPYSAIVMGPGTGKHPRTSKVLKELLQQCKVPLILDADAINILAENKDWLDLLPADTILTPHIGEYKKLMNINELKDHYLDDLRDFCKEKKVFLVLKDAISTITSPQGYQYFVKSGSPALATAGSGDTLTGILAALAGGGYTPLESVLLGVWMHGRAGKLAGSKLSEEATIAGDIPLFMGEVFKELRAKS